MIIFRRRLTLICYLFFVFSENEMLAARSAVAVATRQFGEYLPFPTKPLRIRRVIFRTELERKASLQRPYDSIFSIYFKVFYYEKIVIFNLIAKNVILLQS